MLSNLIERRRKLRDPMEDLIPIVGGGGDFCLASIVVDPPPTLTIHGVRRQTVSKTDIML